MVLPLTRTVLVQLHKNIPLETGWRNEDRKKEKAKRLDKTKGEQRGVLTLFSATIKASQIHLALLLNTYFSQCQTKRVFNSNHTGQT